MCFEELPGNTSIGHANNNHKHEGISIGKHYNNEYVVNTSNQNSQALNAYFNAVPFSSEWEEKDPPSIHKTCLTVTVVAKRESV